MNEYAKPDSPADHIALDSSRPNAARIYDVLLGGKDNYAADREAARNLVAAIPHAARAARDNRAFLARVVRYLASEAGISQFLDIGTGLPVHGHVHEIAQEANPAARVAYVDNDTNVVTHARALLADSHAVIAVNGDVRYPRHLLTMPEVRDLIDFDQPVAVLLIAVLHFVSDSESPWSAVRAITDHLAPGSYVAVSHVTGDGIPDDAIKQAAEIYDRALIGGAARRRSEIARFFAGLEMVEPGLVDVAEWRSSRRARAVRRPVIFWAGVGRKGGRYA